MKKIHQSDKGKRAGAVVYSSCSADSGMAGMRGNSCSTVSFWNNWGLGGLNYVKTSKYEKVEEQNTAICKIWDEDWRKQSVTRWESKMYMK